MAIDDARRLKIENHVAFLSGVIKETQAEYGKQILSLSSGVLALSASFIKNVVNISSAKWVALVYFAWGALLFAILCTLAAMRASAHANKKYKSELEAILARNEEKEPPITWSEKWIPHFTRIATLLFAAGLAGLVLFSSKNLHEERIMSKLNEVQKPNDSNTTRVRDSVEVQRLPNTSPQPATTPSAHPGPPSETEKKP